VRSFRNNLSDRRKSFLSFAGQIESQLREAYEHRHIESGENQATLGAKLGVGRSAINKRLTGRINMTMETIADMALLARALDFPIAVRPPKANREWVTRLLDAGVWNIHCPQVKTADEAAAIVAATRYAPWGSRGMGGLGPATDFETPIDRCREIAAPGQAYP